MTFTNGNMNTNEAAGVSSIFLIDVKKGARAYRYDVEIGTTLPTGRTRSLTKAKNE